MAGQRTKWRRNIAENFNRLSRAVGTGHTNVTDDRQTDGLTGYDIIANVQFATVTSVL